MFLVLGVLGYYFFMIIGVPSYCLRRLYAGAAPSYFFMVLGVLSYYFFMIIGVPSYCLRRFSAGAAVSAALCGCGAFSS